MIAVMGVIAFQLGAAIGSFVNVAVDRIRTGQPLAVSRSSCPECGLVLGPLDLVPVVSYLWLRGKCRRCKATIPLRLVVVELVSGLVFLGGYLLFRPAGPILTLAAIAVILAVFGAARMARRG